MSQDGRPATDPARPVLERRLFLVLLLLVAVIPWFLIREHRLPRGHATRQSYALQYFFLTDAAHGGEVPLWMPFAAQGTVSHEPLSDQAGLLPAALLLVAEALKGADFLLLFHAGMALQELLFAVGVWMLARRFFPSPQAVFFVSVAALGSCLWTDHAWANLHACAALPLLLSLVHEHLDSGRRGPLLLALNLALLQTMGNAASTALLAPLAAGLYFGARRLVVGRGAETPGSEGPWTRREGLLALLSFVLLGAVVATRLWGAAGVVRAGDAPGSFLDDLLASLGLLNPAHYLDFFLGLSTSLDFTLYAGMFTVVFALLGLAAFPPRTARRIVAAGAAAFVLFGASLAVLHALAPATRPPHLIAASAPFVRLFVVFLSGAGFQALQDRRGPGRRAFAIAASSLLLLSGALALQSGAAVARSTFASFSTEMFKGSAPPGSIPPGLDSNVLFSELTGASSLAALLSGGVLLLCAAGPRTIPLALGLTLFLHPLDVFGWKFRMCWIKTQPLTAAQREAQKLHPPPFRERRSETRNSNERFLLFKDLAAQPPADPTPRYGRDSWLTDSYWFADLPSSRPEVGRRMRPVDDLLRAAGASSPAFASLAGLTSDKLQVFSRARRAVSDEEIARRISDREFRGEFLFLRGDGETGPPPPADGEREAAACEVLGFSSNRLRLRTATVPAGCWLSYSDAWDPSWTAEVNGKPVTVERANLACKAVPLEAGENVVEFRFRSPLRRLCFALVGLNSLLWMILLAGRTARLLGRRRT